MINIGPNTEPCDTPITDFPSSETDSFTCINGFLSFKKMFSSFNATGYRQII